MITLVLVWTNEAHGLIWSSITTDMSGTLFVLVLGHGTWFWIYTSYSYMLILLGMLVVANVFFHTPDIYGKQAVAWLVSAATPWAANWLFSVQLTPVSHLNLTPFAFIISSFAVAWALFQAGLLNLSPLARNTIVEKMVNGVLVLDTQDRIVDYNPAVQRVLGTSSSLAIGHPIEEVWPDALELRQSSADRQGGSLEITSSVNGERHIFEVNTSALYDGRGQVIGRAVIFNRITNRKRAEERIEELLRHNRLILDSAGEGICGLDLNGKITFANPAVTRMLGWRAEELIGHIQHDIFHHSKADGTPYPRGECPIQATLKDGAIHYVVDEVFWRKDGSHLFVEYISTPIWDEEGNLEGAVVTLRDTTERHRAQDALRESENLYQKLFENTPVGTGIADESGNLITYNSAMLRPGGYTREDMARIGNVAHLYTDPDERDRVLAIAQEQGFVLKHEVQFKHKDGTSYDTLVTLTPAVVQGKRRWQAVVEDITERNKVEDERIQHAKELQEAFDNLQNTQQQLIQSAKLAAIGELVSGIAHELNNPLASVSGMSQLLMRMDLDETLRKDVEIIRYEAERAAKIVQNLLSFARNHRAEKRHGSVNAALERVLELRAYEMKAGGVELESDLQPDLPETWFDFYQMQQVFLNIIINAEQAMSEDGGVGKLCIRTQRVDEKIHIRFADDGPGIPKENIDRIFDPFFTTKEVGKGTGLGLSLCHGIVKEHDGLLWVESELGKGSTFTVELPITRE